MIARRRSHRFSVTLPAMAALASGLWLSAGPIAAQEAGSPESKKVAPRPSPPSPEDLQIKAYYLRYADAGSIEDTLQRLAPNLPIRSLAVDARSNRILIMAQPEVQKQVEALLELLDTPAEEKEPGQLRVFRVEHAPVESVVPILSEVFASDEVRISADTRTNSIVVLASPAQLAELEALIKMVDRESEPRLDLPMPFHVRVIWLADGLEADDAPEPAGDLKDVLAELEKIGVTGLRQVGQATVYTLDDCEFEINCLPTYGEGASEMKISGRLNAEHGDLPYLSISVSAEQTLYVGPTKPGPLVKPARVTHRGLVSLQTDITAPYGHYVVLGVTPVEKTTSVFVVQVTPSK
jgi:hypothetical protein